MFPLWLKVAYTAMAALVVAVYFVKYGPQNYLWFSDLALIATVPALWLEHRLLASTVAVGVLLPELAWNLDFFGRLLTGRKLIGLSDYMFDPNKPRYLRGLSLFHVVLPAVVVLLVARLGYDPTALIVQTVVSCIVLPLTYAVTDPRDNINWVFGLWGKSKRKRVGYLFPLMLAFPICIYLPTHALLQWLFPAG